MTVELAVELYRETIRTAALVGAPILGTAMAVGLCVSLLQTLTSVQEQTLTFVPKILAIATVVAIGLPWILAQLMNFLTLIVQNTPAAILAGG